MPKMSIRRAAEDRLRGLFDELAAGNDARDLVSFCQHARIPFATTAEAVWPTFLAHYQRRDGVSETQVAQDLATWGPIASRVIELIQESRHA
ncbi:hypothetical protein GCM10007036_10650 [Alsobacter metallidurans]|uniref:Uncharacterized protein n=1 Tax=Alsobacter metallidurans TaxID=340221 RepID=A0A917I5B3_9HYPH|nr:hypothetical protein [Alsobacter metallidurans]GGH12637.1 hypothetical protein GCM10007036_10650 [Alsobacter metallidurans]